MSLVLKAGAWVSLGGGGGARSVCGAYDKGSRPSKCVSDVGRGRRVDSVSVDVWGGKARRYPL